MNKWHRPARLSALAVLAAAVAPLAKGQTVSSWTGTGGNNLWNNSANWDNGVPIAGFQAQFNANGNGFTALSLGGGTQTLNSILFAGTPAAYNLGVTAGDNFFFDSGGSITVNPEVTNSQIITAAVATAGSFTVLNNMTSGTTGLALTLNGNLMIGGGGTLTVTNNTAGTTTILNGNLSEAAGLPASVIYNNANTGTFVINGTNTYSGTTTFSSPTAATVQGIAQIGTSSVMSGTSIVSGPLGTGTVVFNTNASNPFKLQPLGADRVIANPITMTAAGFFITSAPGTNAYNLTLSGPIAAGARTLTDNILPGASAIFGLAGATSTLSLTGQLTVQTQVTSGASLIINDLIKDGTAKGTLLVQNNLFVTLTNPGNSMTGGVLSNKGATVSISSDGNLGAATATTTISAGTLLSTASFTTPRTINLTGTAGANVVDATAGNIFALSGTVSGGSVVGFTKGSNAGAVSLTGTKNTYTGPTTIIGGSLLVASDLSLGAATSNSAVNINAGALVSTGSFSSSRAVNFNDAASTLDATATNTLSLTGTLGGAGNFIKGTNAGTVQLAQTNAVTFPAVTATGGTLSVGPSSVFDNSNPNGPVVTSGGLTNTLTITGALTINGGSKVALNPTAPGAGLTHSVGSLSIAANSTLDIGNHGVLVQSAPDETVIQHYLERGYAGGFWNGRSAAGGSITSVTAFNDNSGATSVGFGNSADFAGTPSPYAPGGAKALTGNQVVVKTALAGDLLLRGGVGANELSLLLNSYGTKLYDGVHPNTWAYGNIDYSPDGTVGANDLSLLLGNYGKSQGGAGSLAKTAGAAATLTSSVSDGAASPSVAPANGIELDVNLLTGHVYLNGNNASAVTAVNLASAAGALIGNTNFTPEFNALFPSTAANSANQINAFNTATNGATVNGLIDMGVVFNVNAGHGELTFQFSQKGINRGGLQDATVVYIVPEPTSLCTIGLAAAGLLGRRRRKASVA